MILAFALLLSGTTSLEALVDSQASSPPPMRKARDPDIAVREELDAARKARTLAAYDLFLARHPAHALAKVACKERAILAGEASGRQ